MQIAYSLSNRIGSFNISHEWLNSGADRPLLHALFGLCVVLHVEPNASGRGLTYIAASELFQELAEGEEIPEYRIEFACDMPFENPEREAQRLNSGAFGFVAIRQNIVRVPPAQLVFRPAVPGRPLH